MNGWDISENGHAAASDVNISSTPYQIGKEKSVVFPPPSFSSDEKWVKEYIEQFGQEPNFF